MIPNAEKERWHYLAVKQISALFNGTTWKYKGDFYCLNCLDSFRTENKLKSRKKVCKSKDCCGTVMPSQKYSMLQFIQYMKFDKMLYIISAGFESLTKN